MSTLDDPPPPVPGVRLLFSLDPGVSYLNHGAFGAVPLPVQRAQQRLRDEMEGDPARFFITGLSDRIAHARRHLAAFLGADPDASALVANASTATAIVLNTLGSRAGDEIVTTDHGYPAVAVAVDRYCRTTGAVHRTARVPLRSDAGAVTAAVGEQLSDRTRLVIVDQITSPTARLFPVAEIVRAAHERGAAVLVDAAHVPGALDVEVSAIGADFWVGNLHKWAYAPRATALLVADGRWHGRILPLVSSTRPDARYPESLEWPGTSDFTSWLAAPVGLFTLRSLGVAAVREHNVALAAYGQRLVGAALGTADRDLCGSGGEAELPMRVIPLPDGHAATPAVAETLRRAIADELSCEVAVPSWRGRGLLRLSAQVYNRVEEYQRLAHGLPGLLRRMRGRG